MSFHDLPENWSDLPLDTPGLAADVADLVVGDEDRANGCVGLILVGPDRRMAQPCLVNEVDDTLSRGKPVRVAVVGDGTGELRATFHAGRGDDISPGDVVALTGKARRNGNGPVYMSDPSYRIIGATEESTASQ